MPKLSFRRPSWKLVALYSVSILLPFTIENSAELLEFFSNECEQPAQGPAANIAAW